MSSILDYYWPSYTDDGHTHRFFARIDDDFPHIWNLLGLLDRTQVITNLDACRVSMALQTVAVTYRTSSSSSSF